MYLKNIHIYPIKSARGISLSSSRLDDCGLELDRRWMLIDENGGFLTQRTLPRMSLIHVDVHADHLVVHSAGTDTLAIPAHLDSGAMTRVRVWGDSVEAIDCGDEAARWFTALLGKACRLVRRSDAAIRLVDRKYSARDTSLSFADSFPVHLISQASLDDLNTRLAHPVPMNRFRPNLVISGCAPYDEDNWRTVQIGNITFRVVKPCSRCTVPTVDQETGIRSAEPIRTLESYRRRDGKVHFGQNLIHESTGSVRVDDAVSVEHR